MNCHLCERPAVGCCQRCGKAYCGQHGDGVCVSCGESLQTSPSPAPAPEESPRRYDSSWRSGPSVRRFDGEPFCHLCGEPADGDCGKCRRGYCWNHKGRGNRWAMFCSACQRGIDRANIIGIVVLAAAVLIGPAIVVFQLLLQYAFR